MFRWLLMILAIALVALLMGFERSAAAAPGTARMTFFVAIALAMMGVLARGNRDH